MKFTTAAAVLLLAAACGAAPAAVREASTNIHRDSVIAATKFIFMDGAPATEQERRAEIDSMRRVISMFYADQFRHFQDPEAPYFMFMSKDAQLAMGIGGLVRMRGYYDWGGAMPGPGFAPYLIPIPEDPTNTRHLGTTPSGTALFFRVIGRNKTLGNYQVYIEANFNGYQSRDFHLKKAYAIINDFTVGYAPSTFSDPAAQPPTVDAQGANNKITPTSVLVRWMPTWRGSLSTGISLETPSTEVDADGTKTAATSNWLPDFAACLQYQWARGEHVRLSGILRTLVYRDLADSRNHNVTGWGVQLSSVAHPLLPEITTYATFVYGHGYMGLGTDMSCGKYDLVANADKPGSLYAPAGFGYCLGVQYNFRPDLFCSLSASQMRYLPKHPVSPDEYKYGVCCTANVFWNLTARIMAGAEVDLGVRHNFDGTHRWARRAGLMCQFSF